MKKQLTFLLLGLIAGAILIILGSWSLVILAYGVGPLVFAAVLAAIAYSRTWAHTPVSFLRIGLGLLIASGTYLAALLAFSVIAGFSPEWFGVRPSENIVQFRGDVWLGLIAAGIVGAIGFTVLATVLTRQWSTPLLIRLMCVAVFTIAATYVINWPFRTYWSFLGVLLPVGSGLFTWSIGREIIGSAKVQRADG